MRKIRCELAVIALHDSLTLHFSGVSSSLKLLSQRFNDSFALDYDSSASVRLISLSRSDGKWVVGLGICCSS
uniref:DEAD-box ATP-dependent RNA helicase 22 n=1 Tax=Noccaea caerulescens TaxID=107243 RepID=A0A1J3J078_NOCCA